MPYAHPTPIERGHLEALLRAGWSQADIARELGRSRSTVSREVVRNRGPRGRYVAVQAQERCIARRARRVRPRVLEQHQYLRHYVYSKLELDWSPEQIAGRLRIEFPHDPRMRVSHETIYTHVYNDKANNGGLFMHLRHAHRKRRRRGNRNDKRGRIPGTVSIEKRPKSVEARRSTGHWEGDTVFGAGHSTAVLTLVERKHGYLIAGKVDNKTAAAVGGALIDLFAQVPRTFAKTLTVDNGKEFAGFKALEAAHRINVYFAHAYCAWERGTNENTNGLLRQYLPKKTDLRTLTQTQLNAIIDSLNNRPRKRLAYRTPSEAYAKAVVALRL